jgi:hypothetical protein
LIDRSIDLLLTESQKEEEEEEEVELSKTWMRWSASYSALVKKLFVEF